MQKRESIKSQHIILRFMGGASIVCAMLGILLSNAWWIFAIAGIVLGGEARVSKDATARWLGMIGETMIGITIVFIYAWVITQIIK